MSDGVASVGEVREVVVGLAAALGARGFDREAARLEEAAGFSGEEAEGLLVMREALVVTRSEWVELPKGVTARTALAAAKRIAIEL